MNSLSVLWEFRGAFLSGLATTGALVGLTAVGGTVLGVALEWLCEENEGFTRRMVDVVAFCIAAIPALVVLFWLYYPLQNRLSIVVSPFATALSTLLVLNTFSVYRIVADAVHDFPRQYISTALVCGLSEREITRHIRLPLLTRSTLPRWIDQQVVILQTSLFASFISVEEIFRVAQRVNSIKYHPVTIYTSMALLFLVTAGASMYYARVLRTRAYRDTSER